MKNSLRCGLLADSVCCRCATKKNALSFGLIVMAASLLGGCAARPMTAPAETARKMSEQKKMPEASFERILGAYSIDPMLLIGLNPALCLEYGDDDYAAEDYYPLIEEFQKRKAAYPEAIARVNAGAFHWLHNEPRKAYEQIVAARDIFTRLMDSAGLALCFEWLAYMFAASEDYELAGENFHVAHSLYEYLGDEAALKRIEHYRF